MTMQEFVTNEQIILEAVRVPFRLDMQTNQWADDARHWAITLRKVGKGPHTPMRLMFSQGSAHTKAPTVHDVLDCLASDARSGAATFEDFCSDLGYDVDSRNALRTYQAVRKSARELRAFLGPEVYRTLVNNVEAL